MMMCVTDPFQVLNLTRLLRVLCIYSNLQEVIMFDVHILTGLKYLGLWDTIVGNTPQYSKLNNIIKTRLISIRLLEHLRSPMLLVEVGKIRAPYHLCEEKREIFLLRYISFSYHIFV